MDNLLLNLNYQVLHAAIVRHLKEYADELANRYEVDTVPELPRVLNLIEKLDGKGYCPTSWSL